MSIFSNYQARYEGTEQEEYDLKRSAYFESRSLKVIRFTNRDVLTNIEGVEVVILQEISNQSHHL